MKIKKFMPLVAAVTLVAACTGGGGDSADTNGYTHSCSTTTTRN